MAREPRDRRRPILGLVGVVVALALAAPTDARAQQDTTRVDTLAADTIPADTLTPRERALQRLRSLRVNPVQGDTVLTDSLAADSLAADSAAVAARDTLPLDSVAAPPGARLPTDSSDLLVSGDSVPALLRSLRGYEVTEYTGEAAVFEADSNRLRLTGASHVARADNSLETDSVIVYNGESQVVCGYGNPVLRGTGQAEPVTSRRVCWDIERDVGEARGAETQFVKNATWYVRGAQNQVYLLTSGGENELYGRKTEFTSCDLPEPHYVFEAKSLKMEEGGVLVARDVTLKFEDVPVFWLPWMVQPTKAGRRSGLLTPQFGVNDIVRNGSGYNRHISNLGFYWAVNDYASARGTFDWFSGNWKAVEGALSYRWLRQFLQGGLSVKQYWRESGRRDLTLNTQNNWQPDERTRLNVSGTYVTSTDFVKRNSFSPNELNRQITMSASANRSFGWGSVNLGYNRSQNLSDNRVVQTMPELSLSLSPITLYSNDTGDFNVTWNGSGRFSRKLSDIDAALQPTLRDSETRLASAQHSIGFGRFGFSQNITYDQDIQGARAASDTLSVPCGILRDDGQTCDLPFTDAVPEESEERVNWGTSLSYQQNLWTGTTLTPRLSIGGASTRNEKTDGSFVARPNQISTGASLNTAIYGFWPGFGPFSRIRHKIAPTVSWSYSPGLDSTDISDIQREVFGVDSLREQNRVTISFNQTFEAKYAESDTAMVDTATVEDAATGEPRRLPQARKIMLLALNTSGSLEYDFVAAREEGRGFRTKQISNSIKSDLLRGFQLTTTHDLFSGDDLPADSLGKLPPRKFAPFLTRVSARFSIDDDFWLFRFLGLSGGEPADTARQEEPDTASLASQQPAVGAESGAGITPGGMESIVPGRESENRGGRRGIGGWQASLDYSLIRRRPEESRGSDESQMLRANVSFQPTEHWSVRWSTGYSFTEGEFSDHVLTLSRDLHRWQANFDFVKAQNGNFAFQFRVELTDQPDLKVDYDQRTDPRNNQ